MRREGCHSGSPRAQMKHWDSWGPLGMQAQDAHPWGSHVKQACPGCSPSCCAQLRRLGPGGAVPCTGFCQVRRVPAWAVRRAGCSGLLRFKAPLLAEVSSARRGRGVYQFGGTDLGQHTLSIPPSDGLVERREILTVSSFRGCVARIQEPAGHLALRALSLSKPQSSGRG